MLSPNSFVIQLEERTKTTECDRDINESCEWLARKWFKRFRNGHLSEEDRGRMEIPFPSIMVNERSSLRKMSENTFQIWQQHFKLARKLPVNI